MSGIGGVFRDFWLQDCRGPALAHTHSDHVGNDPKLHDLCPCRECGLTPERWGLMVKPNIVRLDPNADVAMREAGVVDPDDMPLALPQPGEMDAPPVMERGLNNAPHLRANRYKQWEGLLNDYVNGDPNGPGRGKLSDAWMEWADKAEWRS